MKFWLSTLLVLVAFVTGRASGTNVAYPGMAPYTPTRLEWLELQCWIGIKEDTANIATGSGLMVDTIARPPGTIVLKVRYMPNEPRDVMNKIIEDKKQLIHAAAKGRQWDSWLKIEEDVAPLMGDK